MRTGIVTITALTLLFVACGSPADSPAAGVTSTTLPSADVDPTEPTLAVRPDVVGPPDNSLVRLGDTLPPASNVNRPLTPVGAACWALTEVTAVATGRIYARAVADDPTLISQESAGVEVDPALLVDQPEITPLESIDAAIVALSEHAPPAQDNRTDDIGSFSQRLLAALQEARLDVAAAATDTAYAGIIETHLGDILLWPESKGFERAAEASPHCR